MRSMTVRQFYDWIYTQLLTWDVDIRDDIREECSKFGTVLDVKIPRPTSSAQTSEPGVGKVCTASCDGGYVANPARFMFCSSKSTLLGEV
jgi:hypothetical protein